MSDDYITGIYVRIQRDGHWDAIDIAALTDAELATFFVADNPDHLRKFAIGLAKWIRDHVIVVPKDDPPF